MCHHEWAKAHSLRPSELEPLVRGPTLIYLYYISQPILMPRFGNLLLGASVSSLPQRTSPDGSVVKRKIPSSFKNL